MSILTGAEIMNQAMQGRITISPLSPQNINPASIDLTLGNEVAVYSRWVDCSTAECWDHQNPPFQARGPYDGSYLQPNPHYNYVQDVKDEPLVKRFTIDAERGWILLPNILYLMHTKERVKTDHYVPVLDGKSSIGRLGVMIHLTAGYGDPGFDGQYTLEVTTVHPVRVYLGMRFCQMRFHSLVGSAAWSYQDVGHYTGDAACGPVPSKAYKQFE